MRRKLAVGTAALAAAGGGFGAATVLGSESSITAPEVNQVRVELRERAPRARVLAGVRRKPRIIYLQSSSTVDAANPAVGPHVDIRLSARACRGKGRVLGGGVAPASANVFQQGTYILPDQGEYHVLLGLDDAAAASPSAYQISSHLICARGVR
jgi:hypothetical protein